MTVNIRDVGADYGKQQVLRGITLPPVEPGAITALIGPNGAGKSTLLRCIAGLRSYRGDIDITVCGDDGAARNRPVVRYLPQEPPPASSLTVFEAVLLARVQGRGLRVRRSVLTEIEAVLDDVELGELSSRTLAQLSGGQRQMVGLAQAIVCRPQVLLLDEPTSNLDLHNQLAMLDRIRRLAVDGPIAIVVTLHDIAHAARYADQVVVLRDGEVYDRGNPTEVITETMLAQVYRVDATVRVDDEVLSLAITGTVTTTS